MRNRFTALPMLPLLIVALYGEEASALAPYEILVPIGIDPTIFVPVQSPNVVHVETFWEETFYDDTQLSNGLLYCDWHARETFKSYANDSTICDAYANLSWTPRFETEDSWLRCTIEIDGEPISEARVAAPAFIVQSIRYAIPGAKSRLVYTDGSSFSSTFETTTKIGDKLSLKWEPALFGFVTDSQLNLEYSSEGKQTIDRKVQGAQTIVSVSDTVDHLADVFTLWVNPNLTKHFLCGSRGSEYWLGATFQPWLPPGLDPTLPITIDFSAAELLGVVPPDSESKRLLLAQLSRSEILGNVIALDPFFDESGAIKTHPVLGKDRFRPISASTVGGCATSFSGISSLNTSDCVAEYSSDQEDTTKFNVNWSMTVGLKVLGAGGTNELTIAYSRAQTTSKGITTSSSVHLESSSPSVCIDGQLAVDTMFNSIIIPSSAQACP